MAFACKGAIDKMAGLLVIVADRISAILEKGEIQPSYYNPGGVFDRVDILLTNDDRPDLSLLQRMVGNANLQVWNYPDDLCLPPRAPAWLAPWRVRRWARGGVALARQIAPALIRCHGADWNAYLAAAIKAALGIPYVVSMHINPDVNPVRRLQRLQLSRAELRHNAFYAHLEQVGLVNASRVIPVYEPIVPYLQRLGVTRYEVCYNVLNGEHLRRKPSYALGHSPHLLYVGRLFDEKDPGNIIRAVAAMPGVQFTMVGDGPLRPTLVAQVTALGVGDRIRFRPAVANDELCASLADYDLFVVHSEFYEISKSVLEALLCGLPVIINRRQGAPVAELQGDFVHFVANTADDYRRAIDDLLTDHDARAALGQRAYAHAQARWAPAVTEAKVAALYRSLSLQHVCPDN